MTIKGLLFGCMLALSVGAASAQDAEAPQESLKIFFETGSSRIDRDQSAVIDQAARLFREGDPLVMIVSGVADTVGDPAKNLDLSLKRAQAVVTGLTERGIPAARLQVLGRGTSELEVETDPGVAEDQNRVAEITWR